MDVEITDTEHFHSRFIESIFLANGELSDHLVVLILHIDYFKCEQVNSYIVVRSINQYRLLVEVENIFMGNFFNGNHSNKNIFSTMQSLKRDAPPPAFRRETDKDSARSQFVSIQLKKGTSILNIVAKCPIRRDGSFSP